MRKDTAHLPNACFLETGIAFGCTFDHRNYLISGLIKNRFQYRRFGFAWLGIAALAAPMLIFIVFLVMIKIHQHQAYKRLEEQQLVSLVIPESQFRWHKTGKEILVDNRHFDCKEVKKLGDQYYVTGVFDGEEDLLEQELEGTARQSSESAWLAENAMFLVLFADAHDFQVHPPQIITDKNPSQLFADDYTSICTEPLSPPPNPFS